MSGDGGALIKRTELRPTIVSRLALGLAAAAPIGVAFAAGAWIATAVLGACVVAIGTALTKRSVIVDDAGATRSGVLGTTHIPWDDITHYTYWSGPPRAHFTGEDDGSARAINGRYSSVINVRHNLVLYGRDGKKVAITTEFARAGDAIAIAIAELHRRHADRTTFAPFTIEDEGLRHARAGVLPWSQLEEARLVGYPAALQIMKDGKAFPWASLAFGKVHDGCLFLEKLAARGVPVDLGNKQLVTGTLMETLARNAALPRAEVVRRKR